MSPFEGRDPFEVLAGIEFRDVEEVADEILPPICSAFCCIERAGHEGRHTELHYLMLDEHGAQSPPHASCECHG